MSKLYIQTGRLGDILAILPLLCADFKRTGERQRLLVAREFAPVLEGCSYIDPIIFDGSWLDLDGAVALAKTLSSEVIVTSIHGSQESVARHSYSQIGATGRVSSSFQKEAWALAGRLGEWDNNLPLVFDMRSSEREKRLLDASGFKRQNKKPVMLLAVDGGHTAPFPYAALLKDYVHSKFGKDYRIIDLPMVEQPDGRVFDLLAVMEQSDLLITIDSMPLHLAWAVRDLPVFALTNDRDPKGNPSLWHGSPWRPNHLWYCRYHDWPARAVEMMEAIKDPDARISLESEEIFIWLDETSIARSGQQCVCIKRGMCSRELHGKPFVKDAVRMGIQRSLDDDVQIFLSRQNASINAYAVDYKNAFYAYRMNGQHEPIVDLFSAPKSFWRSILREIPDLVLDNECPLWSEALCMIFKRHGAVDQTGCCEFAGGEK